MESHHGDGGREGVTAAPRIAKLDALRGIASLMVVGGHCVGHLYGGLLADGSPWRWAGIFVDAFDAVALFFILSGYVLTLQLKREKTGYGAFLLRRFLRIWPPFAVALLFSFVLLHGSVASVTAQALMQNLMMIGDPGAINGPVWSLFVEMRVALVFPMIVLLVAKAPPMLAIIGGVAFSGLSSRLSHAGFAPLADLGETSRFLYLFIIGAAFAQHEAWFRDLYARLGAKGRAGALFLALALMEYRFIGELPARNYIPTIGVALLFWLLLFSTRAAALLERPLPLLFGAVSYGVYLTHYPILRAVEGALPAPLAAACVLTASLALGALLRRYAEAPTTELARKLSRGAPAASLAHQRST